MVGLFDALVIFQRFRGRGNRLMFFPPPETPHPFLLKRSGKEKQKTATKGKSVRTPEGFGNIRLMPVSHGWEKAFHSFL